MSHYKEHAARALGRIYDKSNTYAEDNAGRNRGIAVGTAASILELGLERMNKEKEVEDRSHPEAPRQPQGSDSDPPSHFVDKFLDRLLHHAIPDDHDKHVLEHRLKDPSRKKKPGLSIRLISSNFKRLASRMGTFFEVQYGIIHIITWRKPSKTLTALVFYTATCLWPHLVLAYPMLFLLFGVIIPGYLHRHPMRTPEIIKVKKRGQSFLSFFDGKFESSIVEDLLNEHTETEIRPPSSSSETSSVLSDLDIIQDAKIDRDDATNKTGAVKSQMALLINMRDLQNLTTDLLKGFDAAEKFCYETAGFKDERLSTFIFYGVIGATYAILFLGQFIPWRLIFIQSGWAGLILCHPASKKFLVQIQERNKAYPAQEKKKQVKQEGEVKKFERQDIIVDESPEIRYVEIFELQMKDVLDTHWSFYQYSNNIFDTKNITRLAHKIPKGVDQLAKVHPVKDWKFDLGFANKWQIDKDPKKWLKFRSLENPKVFEVRDDAEEGWIYDVITLFDEDNAVEFRRRRLFRECYRYARPVKAPKKI
ncbi:Pex24p-domain-containing protein [Suhomyces tanzawaensis NRRL Y-17324]|uniref:Pex24p-domain-containing protein n=1 Tax=Suhomyces tanzawaensis NRRL Y-17324 TaxID=984487 RepID=A0A1E4SGE9_9ASCO|nr:Pex24p-domain-containing protein [Suhomyces tanzawaensis NRRL Y-17324]ODV78587.1 Pex24p-domain-containing protein [Suhomyces tanzawaensis NRRL Y-17324]